MEKIQLLLNHEQRMAIEVATWNLRNLFSVGKLGISMQDMDRLNIDIVSISDTQWSRSVQFDLTKYSTTLEKTTPPNPKNENTTCFTSFPSRNAQF